jgi:AraC-like DNA-binding protein
MGDNFSIISLVHALGLLEGFILGTVLLFANRRNRSSLFLGLFLIGFSVEFLPLLLIDMAILKQNAQMVLFTVSLTWLLFPLFFIYVQKISIFSGQKVRYWVLYPGIASLLLQILIFILPDTVKISLQKFYFFGIYFSLGILYSFYIIIRINQYVQRHEREVKNQFASNKNRLLKWTRSFVILCFIMVTIRVLTIYVEEIPFLHLTLSSINLIIICYITVCGILQFNVLPTFKETSPNEQVANTEIIPPEKIVDLLDRMDRYIEESGIFAKNDLTIADVAASLKEHPRNISYAINKHYNKHFNRYINEFRVKKAQEMIESDVLRTMSIEGLSHEVGFHSKTSFYQWFKKVTGTTPATYSKGMEVY